MFRRKLSDKMLQVMYGQDVVCVRKKFRTKYCKILTYCVRHRKILT
jgi:hypothetical protein